MSVIHDPSISRAKMSARLKQDLIGPRGELEALRGKPSDVYLTGILWPQGSAMPLDQDEKLEFGSAGKSDEKVEEGTEEVPSKSIMRPSSAGLSFAIRSSERHEIGVDLSLALYRKNIEQGEVSWIRKQIYVQVPSLDCDNSSESIDLSDHCGAAAGARLHMRALAGPDCRLVTVTLINDNKPDAGRDETEQQTFFQTEIKVFAVGNTSLVARPSTRAARSQSNDREAESNALLFRNVKEFATGHTCSAEWSEPAVGQYGAEVEFVRSTWLPSSIVPDVSSDGHSVFEVISLGPSDNPMSASFLASAGPAELKSGLDNFCTAYAGWIADNEAEALMLGKEEQKAAASNLAECRKVLDRLGSACVRLNNDTNMRQAFQLANFAMNLQFEWAQSERTAKLTWRPFQLAFLLLASESTIDCQHEDRDVMDLLWFPTGGGKTEAYLALIAMLVFHRRITGEHGEQSKVTAVMRYTLRLLTTQQFSRAVAMIAACEAIRTGRISADLATNIRDTASISIGLWVGDAASPNKRSDAYASLKGAKEFASPRQLARCPCCHSEAQWRQANKSSPVTVHCTNQGCNIQGQLPVWTVDEDIYEEKPTLIIGTIDKFAQIVRNERTIDLFGSRQGVSPDLIVQDELHLISGPLGTISGVYESAIDLIFSASGSSPKIIGSTATIRKAEDQVRALFDRKTCQFPPPGIDFRDSGFAVTKAVETSAEGRRYLGISTAGRSAKYILQAVAGSLLQSALSFPEGDGRDDYWTLLGYFNSLRELGGALVLMQDDVSDSIQLMATARSEKKREVAEVEELTSRRTQEDILNMLDRLETPSTKNTAVDVVLATNMVSVGVDIARLGLMVVNGQPKTISEYIQSTSRVGRGKTAGLVVTILNNAKARDRSHFETFPSWHQALYRDVEATSVTPFASRARDRALHAALVAAVRHLVPGMSGQAEAQLDAVKRSKVEKIVESIAERAERVDREETKVRDELMRLVDAWEAQSPQKYWDDHKPASSLLQSAETAAKKRALGREHGIAWPTMNTMRSVEVGTPIRLAERLRSRRGR